MKKISQSFGSRTKNVAQLNGQFLVDGSSNFFAGTIRGCMCIDTEAFGALDEATL